MTTERFTKEQFEQALKESALDFELLPVRDSEYIYTAKIPGTNKRVKIRSSISPTSGIAHIKGQDSIRIWTEYYYAKRGRWYALGKGDGKRYLTRRPGWEKRLIKTIEQNRQYALLDGKPKTSEPKVSEPRTDTSSEICPKCNRQMVLRTNRKTGRKFWGCSGFPRCKGTRNYIAPQQSSDDVTKLVGSDFQPSNYQRALLDAVLNTANNIVVNAEPGSGKSTSIEWMLPYLPKNIRVGVVAFNKKIAKAFADRVRDNSNAMVSTTHSLGYSIIRKSVRGAQFDQYKVPNYIDLVAKRIEETDPHFANLIAGAKWAITDVVSLLKNTLLKPTIENIVYLTQRYDINLNGVGEDYDKLISVVQSVYHSGLPGKTNIFDFDDMIFWVSTSHYTIKKFDLLFVDELQDLNEAQAVMVEKVANRVVGVGDRQQSIYGFRGADVRAIENFVARFDAVELPLSISYRMPTAHIEWLNERFGSNIIAAPDAKQGTLEDVTEWRFARDVAPGDLVLCRTNAPLIPVAYKLLRAGVKAVVMGRDIGKGLCRLIDKAKASDLDSLANFLIDYRGVEKARLQAQGASVAAEMLADKIDTILAILSNVEGTISDLQAEVESLFSDKREGVTLSTIHKMKGGECERVWILQPELLPHPRAEQEWEKEQEKNVEFVAMSRSKNELYRVITEQ